MNYSKTGLRIKFKEEKISYRIVAANNRYLICTKPFNAKKTYLYTIVDLLDGERGPDNMIFGPLFDYNDPKEAQKGLEALMENKIEISQRNGIKLKIDWVK